LRAKRWMPVWLRAADIEIAGDELLLLDLLD
jgi:hypothetical protein